MERKPFEITIGEHNLALEVGKVVCVLFRTKQEVDYFAVQLDDDETLRVFNNQDMTRWMGGIALKEDGEPYRVYADGRLFRDEYGWNPATIIKESPSEKEEEWWLDINTRDIDEEWRGF